MPLADGFEASARLAGGLATGPEVAARWGDESACEGMTVGGLANHLVAQVDIAVALLGGAPAEQPPIPLLEHYRRAAWVHTELDEDANTAVRDSANAEAGAGLETPPAPAGGRPAPPPPTPARGRGRGAPPRGDPPPGRG